MSEMTKRLAGMSSVRGLSRPSGTTDGLEGRPVDANRGLASGSQIGFKNQIVWLVMSIVLAAPQSTFACAACTGRSDDTVAQGLNAAVLTLLLVLLVVLGVFVSFLVYLIRRAAKHPLPLPDVQQGAV